MYDGADIKDWVLLIGGNIFIIIMVIRSISCYAKKEWGDLVTNLVVAAVIAWIVYSNDSFIEFLKWIFGKLSGGE